MADDKTKSGVSDSAGSPQTESADAGKKSLTELAAEFSAAVKQGEATSAGKEEIDTLKAEVARLQGLEADRSYRREMDENLIPTVKGDLDVHPKHVERWLNEQAGQDSKLQKLWDNREDDPDAFNAAIEALKPKFAAAAKDEGLIGTAKKPDARLAAAVRSARETQTGAPGIEDTSFADLSDTEFELRKREVFRLAAAGQLQ